MMIDRIGALDSIQPGKKVSKTEAVRPEVEADSVAVSSEAVEKGELFHAIEIVGEAADVRMDRVAELKKKINDPDYLNSRLIADTADRIMTAFGL
jgi:negative regulator of flagellin synthesis FlgM